MRTLDELIDRSDPAISVIKTWLASSPHAELLPPSAEREQVLLGTQVTTRSTLGAMAYETGGLLVDGGWLRILGSGHPKLQRTLVDWNSGRTGFYLVADDAVGGFFAIDGGAIGTDVRSVFYLAPDTLGWESLGRGYSDFLQWALTGDLAGFYRDLRWARWQQDVAHLHGDSVLMTMPPLFTREGRSDQAWRAVVPVAESWGLAMQFRAEVGPPPSDGR